ncbi:neocarzinostatin apoprotein domain-containing protein [Nocardia alni]|uniref:neocarzinostatin apoprotein domain-containing protein n=1 Tax=Nocardia alni TaxID=2815723 RepID=UPI001C24CECC|nr:neocarzinostatin apoprotein domain-containing protein [Nocardia alni]
MRTIALRFALPITVAAAVLGAAPSAAAATVSVSQTTGLHAGQTISVALSGLPANLAQVAVGQCLAKVAGPNDCNLSGSLLGHADGRGIWQPNRGSAIALVGSIGGTNCAAAPGTCIIGVTSLTDPAHILSATPLSFG